MNYAPTPLRRIVRTTLQVLVGLVAAIPAAAAAAGVPAATAAAVSGVVGGLVILVSAVQNAWDSTVGNG